MVNKMMNVKHEQLDYSLSEGVNFIDTAEMYAIPPKEKRKEELKKLLELGCRQEVTVRRL